MRGRSILILLLFLLANTGVAQIVLNEVLPSNQGITISEQGRTPDWIEVLNTSSKAVDLLGWRIAMAGKQHVFTRSLLVRPKSRLVLWCDGRIEEGDAHVAFKLDRNGGAIMLIAPNGVTIHDVLTYPVMPADVSIGRWPDGGEGWSFFAQPTPGMANASGDGPVRARCRAPVASALPGQYMHEVRIELSTEPGCHVRYTLDGSNPSLDSAMDYEGPLTVNSNSILRTIATGDQRLSGSEFTGTYFIGSEPREALALMMEPEDLWDDSVGIYTNGRYNNNTRSGPGWERSGRIQRGGTAALDVKVKLHGSGSRGLRKRSFKVHARDGHLFAFGDGTTTNEAILRADASPHAWIRNTTIETLIRRHALHVDMQPSLSMPLYINAAYWGLYRWMPGKNDDWLRQLAGAEAVDVLEGPAAMAVSGNDDHYRAAMERLTADATLDSIEAMIDTKSLIDLACLDLWTGRADHELNMRCYRPKQSGGRWKWVVFDMDLWSTPEENSVERMCSAAAPETPFIPQLLAQRELRSLLLARMTALQASVFSQMSGVADSLNQVHASELLTDHRRWELELESPHPDSSLLMLKRFADQRPAHLFAHLARRTGSRLHSVTIDVPAKEAALILLDGLVLPEGRLQVLCFEGIEMPIEVRPGIGQELVSWKGVALESPAGMVDLGRCRIIRPVLRPLVP